MMMSALSYPPRSSLEIIRLLRSWAITPECKEHQAQQGDEAETGYSLDAP